MAGEEEKDATGSAALSFHPNPATGTTTITCRVQPGADVSVALCDLHGRVLRTLRREECGSMESFALDLAELPRGVYVVHLQAGAMRKSAKLLVQ